MTLTEQKRLPLGVGDDVKIYDDGEDGYPAKWVNGVVTEVGDESFAVQWDDFKKIGWETEYEWQKVTIKGNEICEHGFNNNRKKENK